MLLEIRLIGYELVLSRHKCDLHTGYIWLYVYEPYVSPRNKLYIKTQHMLRGMLERYSKLD